MCAADDINAAFSSPVVKEEWTVLCRDHSALINMGRSYGGFDPLARFGGK